MLWFLHFCCKAFLSSQDPEYVYLKADVVIRNNSNIHQAQKLVIDYETAKYFPLVKNQQFWDLINFQVKVRIGQI